MIKCEQKQRGEERFYFTLQLSGHTKRSRGRNSRQEPWGRNWRRGHEGVQITGLLPLTCSVCFLIIAGLTALGWYKPQWPGTSTINHWSRKYSIDLPTATLHKEMLLIELAFPDSLYGADIMPTRTLALLLNMVPMYFSWPSFLFFSSYSMALLPWDHEKPSHHENQYGNSSPTNHTSMVWPRYTTSRYLLKRLQVNISQRCLFITKAELKHQLACPTEGEWVKNYIFYTW